MSKTVEHSNELEKPKKLDESNQRAVSESILSLIFSVKVGLVDRALSDRDGFIDTTDDVLRNTTELIRCY